MGERVGVLDQHAVAICIQARARRKGKIDAIHKRNAAQIQAGIARVVQLDEFVIAAIQRLIHDLGDVERVEAGRGCENRLGEGAPLIPSQSPGFDGGFALGQAHRRFVALGRGRGRARQGRARVRAIGGEIDVARRGGHSQGEARVHLTAGPVEDGCIHLGIKTGIAKLLQDDGGAPGEVIVQQTIHLGRPMIVAGEHPVSFPIAPAGRFAHDGPVDLLRSTGEPGRGRVVFGVLRVPVWVLGIHVERAAGRKVLMHPVCELQPKFRIGAQPVVEPGGRVSRSDVRDVFVEIVEDGF